MLKRLLFALALLPLGLHATPTRALTLDSQQMLVPDDYDATIYYHLAPNFKDHLYIDVLNNGTERGWAFLDVKYGTVVLWWNKDYNSRNVFDGLASGNSLGYQAQDLNANTGNAFAPMENRILGPQVKISTGYALELSDNVKLGLCLQYATLDQTRDSSTTDGSGAAMLGPASLSRYLSNGGAGYYTDLSVTSYKNIQSSSGLALAPTLGIATSRYALDMKFESLTNGINNSHEESVADSGGTMAGTVTQGLKDKGMPSWLTMGKFRMPIKEGALVIRGGYFNYDFSTEHTQKGVFSGSGFANSDELAGFDHVDAEENYTIKNWDSMVGWTQSFDKARGMMVIGIGANASSTRQEDILYTPRLGGATIKYNDLVRQTRNDVVTETFAVPLVMGSELEIAKFAKCSASVSHNVYGTSMTKTTSESYDSTTGDLASQSISSVGTDSTSAWALNTGLGLYFGSFSWDLAINDNFLASSGGLVNPAYQSTLTWGY